MSDVDVVLQAIRSVERRDREALFALYHPEVEFRDAPSLPYGGTLRGKEQVAANEGWLETWGPLQPTEAERRMDPRVVAEKDGEVVVLYRQRAVDPSGERLDAPVLGLYEVRDGMFAKAQMFHFDTAGLIDYLSRARG
jgi:ketosteroid isomerase-like protein